MNVIIWSTRLRDKWPAGHPNSQPNDFGFIQPKSGGSEGVTGLVQVVEQHEAQISIWLGLKKKKNFYLNIKLRLNAGRRPSFYVFKREIYK